LRERFAIADFRTHRFPEIVGWHDPKESTPLRREMLRFSQVSTKRAFDEVFLEHGRALKPDLIVAMWGHLGDFGQISGDERCLLPADLWGRGEDYLWYSTGAAACFTDLREGVLGEGTLQARYIHGAFDDKPFTLGKYESTRIRAAIAELAANGGAPMGFYVNFRDPMARTEALRYYGFLRENDAIYHANRSVAEVLLLYPRRRVHQGDMAALEAFQRLGRQLLDRHVLFDIRPDDLAAPDSRPGYRRVLDPAAEATARPEDLAGLSQFEAPTTVRVSASRPERESEIDVHFVNYNRIEPPERRSPGSGAGDDRPISVGGVKAALILPEGLRARRVQAIAPEAPTPRDLSFQIEGGRVRFTLPEFLVYEVARIGLEPIRAE
jgi:hypothetical protein